MPKCKLTGLDGKYIKAHIIPKALTRKEKGGNYFVQAGLGGRPTKRFDSWWDGNIVVQQGEDILTELDTWAISELRKHKLVWSGWGPLQKLADQHTPIKGTPWGIRTIESIDTEKLRLFFLSLLWRAAISERFEFSEVDIPSDHADKLRDMIINKNHNPVAFYAVSLTQMSTMGRIHNITPLAMDKIIPSIGESIERQIPIFRFYFDGLMAHFHRGEPDHEYVAGLGDMIIGNSNKLTLSTVTYEESFEKLNLDAIMLDSIHEWPVEMMKLL